MYPFFLKNSAIVGVSFRSPFSSPGATTTDSAERIGMRPVWNDERPAVQLACPYQLVKTSHHTSFNGVTSEVLGDYPGCKLFVHSGGRRDPNHPEKDALAAMKAKALADNIKRLKLNVRTIAPFHGNRLTDVAEVEKAGNAAVATR